MPPWTGPDCKLTTLDGAYTAKCVAAAALTVTDPLLPAIELLAVSAAVNVWLPAILNVTLNVPVPLARAVLAGSRAVSRCWRTGPCPRNRSPCCYRCLLP